MQRGRNEYSKPGRWRTPRTHGTWQPSGSDGPEASSDRTSFLLVPVALALILVPVAILPVALISLFPVSIFEDLVAIQFRPLFLEFTGRVLEVLGQFFPGLLGLLLQFLQASSASASSASTAAAVDSSRANISEAMAAAASQSSAATAAS